MKTICGSDVTCLLATYAQTKSSELIQALMSIEGQTLKPKEVIVVIDGPISIEQELSIYSFKKSSTLPVHIKNIKENVGLGAALNEGLKLVKSTWIMRMDADDISSSDRLAKQVALISGNDVDVCGAQIVEFWGADVPSSFVGLKSRWAPLAHDEVSRMMPRRNPMNHVTALVKTEILRSSGGYNPSLKYYEDYELWFRLMKNGAKFINHNEPLVLVRFNHTQLQSRSGISGGKRELAFQRHLLANKWISKSRFIVNCLIRVSSRLLGARIASLVYSTIRNTKY